MRSSLTSAPVGPSLIRLAWPMLIGIAAIILFNVVDTFWVGQLGTTELAAMSFTFPVVLVVMSLSMGMGVGTTAVVSRAIGSGNDREVQTLTKSALLLAVTLVTAMALLGLATVRPLFVLLGAGPELLPLIEDYMRVWYLGVGFLVIPMVGNSAIRATGDTKTPSVVMMVAGFTNFLLDPVLIFGLGPFPRLELVGAALATVISYVLAFGAALWILVVRERMLSISLPIWSDTLDAWRRVLRIGIPAAGTQMLTPLSSGILTRMIAEYGPTAVASFGVGTRVESLSMIGIAALSTAIAPFVGQNYGARQCGRIREAIRFSLVASLIWGAGAALTLAALASPIARIFNDDPTVVSNTMSYFRLVPMSYGCLGIALLVSSAFNAMEQPMKGAALLAFRLVVLAVPLAYAGSAWYGLPGLFFGIALANFGVGAAAIASVHRHLGRTEARFSEDPLPMSPISENAA